FGCCCAQPVCSMRRLVSAVQGGLGAGARGHPGPSVWFMACYLARPCALVALTVVKLCNSRLCSCLRPPRSRQNARFVCCCVAKIHRGRYESEGTQGRFPVNEESFAFGSFG